MAYILFGKELLLNDVQYARVRGRSVLIFIKRRWWPLCVRFDNKEQACVALMNLCNDLRNAKH